MKLRLTGILYFLMSAVAVFAQNVSVEIRFPKGTDLQGTELYLGDEQCSVNGNLFSATVPESQFGFYSLTTVRNQGQVNSILYIPRGTHQKQLKVQIVDDIYPIVTNDKDCRILTSFAHQQGLRMKSMWVDNLTESQIKDMFSNYKALMREADPEGEASSEVRKYLEILAYSQCWNCLNNIPQVLRKHSWEVTVRPEKVLPSPVLIVDHPYSTEIQGVGQIVCDELRHQRNLESQLQYLYESYKCAAVAKMAVDLLLGQYVTTFNYEKNYTDGLLKLGKVTDKFQLDQKYLMMFRQKAASISGAGFPDGVVLTDADGRAQDFAQFRGKYVVVDLWASWCVPCCREVPYLQKLETEMKDKDIAFLSISVDNTTAPWLQRMSELNMHGNQWISTETKLCESLNVNGIPMFLIYDKYGHLLRYDAPRPSDPRLKEILDLLI